MRCIGLLTLSICICFKLGCGLDSLDIIDAYYPTGTEALKSQSVRNGWLPKDIPQTATEIYDRHNVDTNQVWARWSLVPTDLTKWRENFEVVEVGDVRLPRSPNRRLVKPDVEWWTFESARQSGGLIFLRRLGERDSFWAVSESEGIVYFWRL